MFSKINTMGLFGLNAFSVDVETDISMGQPAFEIVGLPDMVVKESRERIKAAMRAGGIKFPNAKVMVNLAPADTKKSGSVHDLAIFVGILSSMSVINENTDNCCFIGEVSLNGNVRHVNGVLLFFFFPIFYFGGASFRGHYLYEAAIENTKRNSGRYYCTKRKKQKRKCISVCYGIAYPIKYICIFDS